MIETAKIGDGIYSVSDLSDILKIPNHKARYWFNTYVREILPSITNYRYNLNPEIGLFVNFKSLLQFYVFIELRKRKHSKRDILKLYTFIAKTYNTKYPFATKSVFSVGSEILTDVNGNLINQTLQLNMVEILSTYIEKIDFNKEGMAQRFFPIGRDKNIVVDPRIQFGSPTIKGTRIEVDSIISFIQSGESIESTSKTFDLNISQINDALEYRKAA